LGKGRRPPSTTQKEISLRGKKKNPVRGRQTSYILDREETREKVFRLKERKCHEPKREKLTTKFPFMWKAVLKRKRLEELKRGFLQKKKESPTSRIRPPKERSSLFVGESDEQHTMELWKRIRKRKGQNNWGREISTHPLAGEIFVSQGEKRGSVRW